MFFFFQAEDGIRDLVRSRGLGDVYKRQVHFSISRSVGGGGLPPSASTLAAFLHLRRASDERESRGARVSCLLGEAMSVRSACVIGVRVVVGVPAATALACWMTGCTPLVRITPAPVTTSRAVAAVQRQQHALRTRGVLAALSA